jgi:hypothetical protein
MTHWRVYLCQARAETDRDRLLEWVTRAEAAITTRLLVVCDSEDWGQEHEAAVAELKAASEELHRIQIERLCFPDWKETLNKS